MWNQSVRTFQKFYILKPHFQIFIVIGKTLTILFMPENCPIFPQNLVFESRGENTTCHGLMTYIVGKTLRWKMATCPQHYVMSP